MPEFTIDQERLKNQTKLLLKANYIASVAAISFGFICYFILTITKVIPFAFIGFGVLNFINIIALKKHNNFAITNNIASVLAIISSFIITLYSGGIGSSFIFMIVLGAFGGYLTNPKQRTIYLVLSVVLILIVFSQSFTELEFTQNVVPLSLRNVFHFISILLIVFTLYIVFGNNILKEQDFLYASKEKMSLEIHEKENLLKEVHHRVKNNLQTVSSLLSLQSRNLEEGPMKGLLKGTQNRVIAMAMVHEMLYMREDISHIKYKSYAQELSEYLIRSIKGVDNKVTLTLDISDIQLGIDTAIPLGLLINEVVTNALKYGIKDDNPGEIHIGLKKEKEKEYTLRIGDNGIGFSDDVNYKNTKSLGLKLIHNLTRQLRGTVERDNTIKGTNYIIKFQEIKQELPPSLS